MPAAKNIFHLADRIRLPISHCLVMNTNLRKTIGQFTAALVPAFGLAIAPVDLQATTITVTNTADSGAGTLRAALANATSGDTIKLSLTIPATITLTNGELLISNNLSIVGP